MAFKMFLLTFSVLLIVKVTLGETDCENHPVDLCDRPEMKQGIPRDVSSFKNYCVAVKSHLSCINDFQERCGKDRVVFFESSEIFQATYNTISDICEEGTLFNTVATENLKCLNETFSKTRCNGEAEDIVEPLIKEVNENVGSRPNLSIFCLRSMLVSGCALRAISDNCGQLVGAAALDALRRSKSIENDCSVRGAQSVLDELDNLDLSEVQKRSLDQLLGKFVEENSE